MSGPAVEPWAAALGRIPSGLFVVTIRHGRRETGMLASWVQQCSFDPPLITLAVNKERSILEWFEDGTLFVVNILPEGSKSLVAHFGKGFDDGAPAFTGLKLEAHPGPPVLSDANAYLDCSVSGRCDAGDHILILARVTGGRVLHPDTKPTTHVRKSGRHY
jgi:flavin reductase (DIM6/NTAB) family NADH-FMN oxidoreductase RutF